MEEKKCVKSFEQFFEVTKSIHEMSPASRTSASFDLEVKQGPSRGLRPKPPKESREMKT